MPALHGNYTGYQGGARTTTGQSTGAHIVDERLTSIATAIPDLFSARRVLDIGCNAGQVAVDIALGFNPLSVTGLDIDPVLVNKAKSHLSFRWSRLGPDGEIDYFPASSVLESGHVPYPPVSEAFPHNVRFVAEDFVASPLPEVEFGRYGVVMMLSVIKWLHLEGGDEGLMRMFEKVTAALEEGGYFVFEPQDWDSYGHAVKKNRELKAAKEALKIMPEQFPEILERLGLQLEAVLTERKRPISIWKKI